MSAVHSQHTVKQKIFPTERTTPSINNKLSKFSKENSWGTPFSRRATWLAAY